MGPPLADDITCIDRGHEAMKKAEGTVRQMTFGRLPDPPLGVNPWNPRPRR